MTGKPVKCVRCEEARQLDRLRRARDDLAEAKKMSCTCSGFGFQYNGGCTCARDATIRAAEEKLDSLLDTL